MDSPSLNHPYTVEGKQLSSIPSFQDELFTQGASTGKHLQGRTERLLAGFLGKLTLKNWSPSPLLTPWRRALAGSLEAGACSAAAGGASSTGPADQPGRCGQGRLCRGQRGSPGRRAAAAARSPSAPPARPGRRCCGGRRGTTPAAPHGSSLRCDASPRRRYLSEERKNQQK